jgi:hypothetical protein
VRIYKSATVFTDIGITASASLLLLVATEYWRIYIHTLHERTLGEIARSDIDKYFALYDPYVILDACIHATCICDYTHEE